MGWGRSDLKTQDFHPHTVFDGMEAAEDKGQGRCPREDAEQPGTKAGMRGSRTLTHTQAHTPDLQRALHPALPSPQPHRWVVKGAKQEHKPDLPQLTGGCFSAHTCEHPLSRF